MTSKRYPSYWDDTAPDFSYQPQLPTAVDVVIIGAGVAGLSTAYWLARLSKRTKAQLKIVVVDEAPHPAFKASGRINGSIYLGSHKMPSNVVKTLGVKAAKSLYRYGAANNALLFSLLAQGMSCGLESNGGLRIATTAREAEELDKSNAFLQDKAGITSARFDHNQTQHIALMPTADGALYIPFEGMVDPFAFCNNLSRLLRTAAGVQIFYGARVASVPTSSPSSKEKPVVIMANGHVIQASAIVHATTKTQPCSYLKTQIVYKREHVIRTNPFGEDLNDMALPLMPIELGTTPDSVRISNRSLIMTGGKTGFRADPEMNIENDSDYSKRVFDQLNSDMLRHFPFTNLLEITHNWTYIESTVSDTLPAMGKLSLHPGHYVNAGHGRNKFGLAFLGGQHLAEIIFGRVLSNEDFGIFTPDRFIVRG